MFPAHDPAALRFAELGGSAIPLHAVGPEDMDALRAVLPEGAASWLDRLGFGAGTGETVLLPGADGAPAAAVVGLGGIAARGRHRFTVSAARAKLPKGVYALADGSDADAEEAALGWLLAGYRFAGYKAAKPPPAMLAPPEGVDAPRLEAIAAGEALSRDLINATAADMGPAELAEAARRLAVRFGARCEVIEGESLREGFPMIHAVGRAAIPERAPRLIDLRHGEAGPRLTLIGKGICFDTGGLNLKPGSSMGLMKKDMGGAAAVLGLAEMMLATGMRYRLRVLIPAAENAVAGASMRPGDVLRSRSGKTVEVNNTDAEGRLVLADALTYSGETESDLTITMATLTGAARVAVGSDISPFFTGHERLAAALPAAGDRVRDPVWRMPFHDPYEAMIEPAVADLDNAPTGGMAGTITAALFLRRFAADPARYAHFDIYGWNAAAKPARPKGGVGMATRALLEALPGVLG